MTNLKYMAISLPLSFLLVLFFCDWILLISMVETLACCQILDIHWSERNYFCLRSLNSLKRRLICERISRIAHDSDHNALQRDLSIGSCCMKIEAQSIRHLRRVFLLSYGPLTECIFSISNIESVKSPVICVMYGLLSLGYLVTYQF